MSPDVLPDGQAEAPPVAPAEPRPAGPDVIAGYLRTLPGSPGVYRMIDAAGAVIYVGKARSLKARVANYARLNGHSNRIARMIMATAAMEFVTTRTESDALLLEANLIKRFRPRYNVLLRDDKSFPYILIAGDQRSAQILKHRGARNRKGDYFGPFASAGSVARAINTLQRAFLLRSCADSVYESRTRPCLLHQIKRCSAPCTGEIAPEDYARLVEEACRFLKGDSAEVRATLQAMMQMASDKLEFERAATYRNRLQALAHVTADQSINPDGVEEADVFAAAQDGGQTCVQVFFFRVGQNWGNRAYFPRADRSLPAAEVLESFIAQFYDDKPVPRLILASHDFETRELMAEALSTKAERRVEVRVPERGRKSDLVDHATANAREALGRRLAEASSQRRLLEGLAERLGLARVPRRVEVFDNSHIMGASAVGAMIVAGSDGLVKGQYRKFNIKSADLTPGDDYAMMREVLERRFKRLVAPAHENTSSTSDAPASANEHASPPPSRRRRALGSTWGRDRVGGSHDAHDHGAEPQSQPSGLPPPLAPPHKGEGDHSAIGRDVPEAAIDPDTPSRITPPTRPPRTERGVDTIAFGVVPAEVLGAPEDVTDEEDRETDGFPDQPDLVLIDGGAGQLGVAEAVLAELGIKDVALVGIAKGPDRDAGREHFHIPGRGRSLMLEPRDPVLYFVQRLRDEAHRFAIGTHRAKRSKALAANPLDDIAGIGPTRKRALLLHFGSAKGVSRASVEDLKAVTGISGEMAQKVYDFFHEKEG